MLYSSFMGWQSNCDIKFYVIWIWNILVMEHYTESFVMCYLFCVLSCSTKYHVISLIYTHCVDYKESSKGRGALIYFHMSSSLRTQISYPEYWSEHVKIPTLITDLGRTLQLIILSHNFHHWQPHVQHTTLTCHQPVLPLKDF